MIRPRLKDVDALELDVPPPDWAPQLDEPVWYELTLHIGPADQDGVDLYRVVVANAAGRRSQRPRTPAPPIVVEPYTWAAVLREVERRLEACEDVSWLGVQHALRTRFDWEYEGM